MRTMPPLFHRSFWGLLLLLVGVLFLIREVFGIAVPVAGIFWSVLFIALGISLLAPPQSRSNERTALFDDAVLKLLEPGQEYSAIFSRAEFNLRDVKPTKVRDWLKVNCIFSGGTVRLNHSTPCKVKASAVFGEVRLPDGRSVSFGDITYTTPSFNEDKPYLYVEATAVFGGLEIYESKTLA